MKTLIDLIRDGKSRDEAVIRLGEAWRAVIEGRGSREDGELILTDLANESGYFVAPADVSDQTLREHNGRRAVFARILFLVDISIAELDDARRSTLRLSQLNDEE